MLKTIFLLTLVALATCSLPGWEDASIDDENVLAAANHGAKGLSKEFAGPYHHILVKVLKAKKQVVDGNNYKVDLIIGKTNCKKDEVEFENAADCDFQDGISTYKKCQVIVHRDLNYNQKLVGYACSFTSKVNF
ncbi:unnamed protein product [Larinioides sclopetarius]|uniref:Cystatin domain-containing protein n=1 Tax=Larinioides sclopetarius TaxID=280406 RepID=A0AAV2BMI5_9ARAC